MNYNLYPDNNGRGNTAMGKTDLKKGGYPSGLTLNYEYQNDSSNTRAFTASQASLANCGIKLASKRPNCVVNTVNYGCYDNPTVNSLITQAEGATSTSAAGTAWHQADMDIMKDAANIGEPDITNLWLSGS